MNKIKGFLAVLVCMAMAVAVLPCMGVSAAEIVANGECGDNLTWTLDSDGTLTISGTGAMTDWDSSSKAPWYSNRSSIKTVVIENGVRSIGDSAFGDCTGLTSVNIPDSVTTIGGWAFEYCTGLTSINVSDENKNYTDIDGVLFTKDVTVLVKYPAGKPQTEYNIPDSVTTIGGGAFSWCENLTSVTIPDSVTKIGEGAFYGCISLTSVTIGNSVTIIGEDAFWACSRLTSVTIPDSVTSIGENAFADCKSLTSVSISDSVTSIDWGAFSYCSSLTSITIPNSVTSIDGYAFLRCTGLTSVSIPDSVTSIGEWTFYSCTSLTDVYYGGSKKEWNTMSIGSGNNCLTSATIHYNSTDPEPAISDVRLTPETDEETGAEIIAVTVETEDIFESNALLAVGFGDGGAVSVSLVENGEATLPAEGVTTVKVFAWESLESMIPLCEAKEVTVQ